VRGLYDGSLIAVMSDHGESLGEHGEDTHGIFLYDETIHVPLLFKLPREHSGGTRINGRVGLVDVLPTILQGVGVPVPSDVQGESLLSMLKAPAAKAAVDKDPAPAVDHPAYSESDYTHRTFGWSATADAVDPWIYTEISKTFLLDPLMFKRLLDLNPHSLRSLMKRLLEAHERGYWNPDEDVLETLRERLDNSQRDAN